MFDLKVAQSDDSSKHTEDIEVEALSIAHQIPDMCDLVRSVSRSQRLRGAVLHMCSNTPSRGSNILMGFVEEKFVSSEEDSGSMEIPGAHPTIADMATLI